MRVALIFPMRGYEQKFSEITLCLNKFLLKELKILGVAHIDVKFAGMDFTYVANNDSIEGGPKGKIIVDALKSLPYPADFVIVCDGSMKIPLENIQHIFQELISDSSISCAMANRISNKSISKYRYLIERFEIFSLKRYHSHDRDIPDGQCGLWGYRTCEFYVNGKKEQIMLTAEGYEVELDLINEILSRKLNYSFVDIDLPKPSGPIPTNYKHEDSIKKLNFLCSKCSKLKDCLLEYIAEYEESEEFKTIIEQLSKEDIEKWEKEYKSAVHSLVK